MRIWISISPTGRVYWRDRVRDFIERKVRPAVPTYKEQDKAGDRWKVIPDRRGTEGRGEGRGHLEPVHAAQVGGASPCRRDVRIRRPRPHQPRICAVRRGNGPRRFRQRSVQLLGARHRQYGSVPPLRDARAEGEISAAADERRDPLGVSDDRARGGLVRRDQHRNAASSATATIMSSTAPNGGRRARAIRAARSRS